MQKLKSQKLSKYEGQDCDHVKGNMEIYLKYSNTIFMMKATCKMTDMIKKCRQIRLKKKSSPHIQDGLMLSFLLAILLWFFRTTGLMYN
jgi:hypothetical protein